MTSRKALFIVIAFALFPGHAEAKVWSLRHSSGTILLGAGALATGAAVTKKQLGDLVPQAIARYGTQEGAILLAAIAELLRKHPFAAPGAIAAAAAGVTLAYPHLENAANAVITAVGIPGNLYQHQLAAQAQAKVHSVVQTGEFAGSKTRDKSNCPPPVPKNEFMQERGAPIRLKSLAFRQAWSSG